MWPFSKARRFRLKGQYLELGKTDPILAKAHVLAMQKMAEVSEVPPATFPRRLSEITRPLEGLVTVLVWKGQFGEALAISDTCKSLFFHTSLMRKAYHYDLKVGLVATAKETFFELLRVYDRSLFLSYHISGDSLYVFLLGKKNDRPYVCVTKRPGMLYREFSSLYSRIFQGLGSRSGIYSSRFNQLNEELLALAFLNGELLESAAEIFDPHDAHLFVCPHYFLHALPLHLAIRPSGEETFALFSSVHFVPSLGMMVLKQSPLYSRALKKSHRYRFFIDERLPSGLAEREFLQVLTGYKMPGWASLERPSVAFLKEDHASSHIVHFSCHGTSSMRSWEENRLQVCDGTIDARALLSGVNLAGTYLTVLSACETGLMLDLDPHTDRYAGLDMAFWLSGSRSVLSSLWVISEEAAFVFNMLFYHFFIYEGLEPIQAYWFAVTGLRDSAWKGLIGDRLEAMRKGQWPEESAIHLRPKLEDLAAKPDDSFTNVVYWAAFKYLGP